MVKNIWFLVIVKNKNKLDMKKLFLFWLAILLSIGAFAQVKISELPEVTSVSTDNILVVVKAGVTSKVQKSNLLQEYAPLASPPLTGVPTAPTAAAGTNTTQIATTAFATTADDLKADIASPTFTGNADIDSITVVYKLIIPANGIIYNSVLITATAEQIN